MKKLFNNEMVISEKGKVLAKLDDVLFYLAATGDVLESEIVYELEDCFALFIFEDDDFDYIKIGK